MNRVRTFLAICALALPIPVLSACGGDDEATEEDPQEVIQRTIDNDTEVTSGVLDLTLSGSAEGEEGGSFEATVAGSFQGEEGEATQLPQLDLTGSITGESEAEDATDVDESGRVVVTEDNAFVEYQDETYEAGPELRQMFDQQVEGQVGDAEGASLREACERGIEQAGGDPAACDIDVLGDWLTNLENEGTEDVEGTESIHITGDVNAQQMLSDLGELAQSVPGVSLEGVDPAQYAEAVEEASFDLYTGADDYLLRRLEARLALDPSAVPGGEEAGVETVEVDFSLTLSELNEEQTIEAPEGPTTPLEQLLGGLGALGGIGGGGGAGGGEGGQPEATGPQGGDLNQQQAQEYLECLEQAQDAGAVEQCAEALE